MKNPVIAHIDMDAFFAAIEQRDRPELRGKPVVVGAHPKGGTGRGVVSTCSYEARRYGIHSAMPISQAFKRCPQAAYLPVDGKKYKQVSDEVFTVLENFTPDIEPVSIDEAFLDLTGVWHLHGSPRAVAERIKDSIKTRLALTASIGIAPVKMLAKIASDYCKPDGLLEIAPGDVFGFLWPLPVERLWGVGPKAKQALNGLGLKTVGQLAAVDREFLYKRFGEQGLHLWDLANGRDPRTVGGADEAKSISNEHTFDVDTVDPQEISRTLLYLCEKVSRRLRKEGLKGKTLSVKVRLPGFKTYTRARTLTERTNYVETLYQEAQKLLAEFVRQKVPVRLIGVKASNFVDPYVQDSLFSFGKEKKEQVHQAVDRIKDRFGENAIRRAR